MYFFATAAISALGLLVGGMIAHINIPAAGLWLPIAGITVAFGMLNPEQQILFFFIIPMKLKYLALLDAVIGPVQLGQYSPIVGVFALAGCAYSYWYMRPGRYRIPQRREQERVVHVFRRRGFLSRFNPARGIREYRDRKRLRKLFERSDFRDNDINGG